MKKILTAVVIMAVIIAVQMGLSYVFTYRVGEIFSRVAVTALFYYYVLEASKMRRLAASK